MHEDKAKEQLMDRLIDGLIELRRGASKLEASESESKQLVERQGVMIGEILIEMGHLTRPQLRTYLNVSSI